MAGPSRVDDRRDRALTAPPLFATGSVAWAANPGCSAAWLARLLWEQEAGSSNLPIPTTSTRCDAIS